jgi:autotransporter passenger strand-loop-strand repeat protein
MTTTTVSNGVVSSGLTVSSGNELQVLSGGVTSSTIILSGGAEFVASGGWAYDVTVSSGGLLGGPGRANSRILDRGLVSGLLIDGSHTTLRVLSGGESVDNYVDGGAGEYISSGGSASGTLAVYGGGEAIEAGGVALGTYVYGDQAAGGFQLVSGLA